MRSDINKHCCSRDHLEAVVVVADCEFEVINNTEMSRRFNWRKCILSNQFKSGNVEAVLFMYSH